uniref:Flagellar basal body rod modification protein n=1 Tax=Angiostrongylus cantonensis TaxID=6313 RepID=A0A0K0D835_ANGCA
SSVFSPDSGPNFDTWTRRIATPKYSRIIHENGIRTVNGINTVYANIGGRRNYNGQQTEELKITVNDDVTVYKTENGKTIVTDGYGNIKPDGGPFRIISTVV